MWTKQLKKTADPSEIFQATGAQTSGSLVWENGPTIVDGFEHVLMTFNESFSFSFY